MKFPINRNAPLIRPEKGKYTNKIMNNYENAEEVSNGVNVF